MPTEAASTIRIADGVWIATALLHKENPERLDFTESEIKARFLAEGLPRGLNTNSLPTNISSHCVANKPRSRKRSDPSKMQGGPYRMIFETRPGYRRLFCPDDYVHPDRIQPRAPSKAIPKREEIPTKYGPLLEWYETWSKEAHASVAPISWEDDPLIRLIGSGRHIWADEHADEYVDRLREEPA